ncbi:MAG: calcium/sodium antiporter, partial [Gammaproteobacteria bacterium]|nr:calcium/sodium antiporter [Gammaproteobacteria bacterium]
GGNPGLSIGNAIGSNITNITLVVGATALVMPIRVSSDTLRREFPLMVLIMLLVLLLLADGELGRLDGILLIVGTILLLSGVAYIGFKASRDDPLEQEFEAEIPATMGAGKAALEMVGGLLFLLISSRMIVWGAVNMAQELGVSDLLIGLTIVAVGTSLPELAATILSTVKKEPDIAVGTIIGSNMFNLLPVLAMPGLIQPSTFDSIVLQRDYPVMLLVTALFFIVAYSFRGPRRINRWEGALLLGCFFAYQALLYFTRS